MSQSKVSRIETGAICPSVEDTEVLCKALHLSQNDARVVEQAMRNLVKLDEQGLFCAVGGSWRHFQAEIGDLERTSTRICSYEVIVPGLLQTAEYIAALAKRDLAVASRFDFVQARLARQHVLFDEQKTFLFLLSESALCTGILDDKGMRMQRNHLITLSTLGNVELGVLPFVVQVSAPRDTHFAILDSTQIVTDGLMGFVSSTYPHDVELHDQYLGELSQSALWGEDARDFIRGLSTAKPGAF